MDRQKFLTHTEFPMSSETLDRLQNMVLDTMQLAAALADRAILSGCQQVGAICQPGYVVAGGEILRFAGGVHSTHVRVQEESDSITVGNTTYAGVIVRRSLVFCQPGETGAMLWSDFEQLLRKLKVPWVSIVERPVAYPPESHSHSWSSITSTPAAYNPVAHTHPWGEVTDKPSAPTMAQFNELREWVRLHLRKSLIYSIHQSSGALGNNDSVPQVYGYERDSSGAQLSQHWVILRRVEGRFGVEVTISGHHADYFTRNIFAIIPNPISVGEVKLTSYDGGRYTSVTFMFSHPSDWQVFHIPISVMGYRTNDAPFNPST